MAFFQISTLSLIFFYEWKFNIVERPLDKVRRYKPNYISFYLSYILAIGIVTQLSIMELIAYKLYVIAGIELFFTIFLCIYRPY